jgi:hypothetical protein
MTEPPLSVRIPHRLGRDEAIRRLKAGLAAAHAKLPILTVPEEMWVGDRLTFQAAAMGQTAAGTLDVADDHVELQVRLPWLLDKFAKAIKAAVEQRGRLLLEKK